MNKLFSILLFSAFLAVISCFPYFLKVTMDDQQFERQIANMSVTVRHSNRYHEHNWKTIITPRSIHFTLVNYAFRFNQVHEVLFKWKLRELPTTVDSPYVYLKCIHVIPDYYENPEDEKKYTRRFCPNASDRKVIHDYQVTLYSC